MNGKRLLTVLLTSALLSVCLTTGISVHAEPDDEQPYYEESQPDEAPEYPGTYDDEPDDDTQDDESSDTDDGDEDDSDTQSDDSNDDDEEPVSDDEQPEYEPDDQPDYEQDYQPEYEPEYEPDYQPEYHPDYQPDYEYSAPVYTAPETTYNETEETEETEESEEEFSEEVYYSEVDTSELTSEDWEQIKNGETSTMELDIGNTASDNEFAQIKQEDGDIHGENDAWYYLLFGIISISMGVVIIAVLIISVIYTKRKSRAANARIFSQLPPDIVDKEKQGRLSMKGTKVKDLTKKQ